MTPFWSFLTFSLLSYIDIYIEYRERASGIMWEKEVMTKGRRRSTRRCRGEDWGGINHARTDMQMGCCCSRGASSKTMITMIKLILLVHSFI